GFLASLALRVPDYIPIIGGFNLGEADAVGVFPRKNFTITSVTGGVVTTSDPTGLAAGGTFKFNSDLAATTPGLDTGKVYYVNPTGPQTFTFSATPGGAPVDLNATGGTITIGPYFIAGWVKFLGTWTIGAKYDFLTGNWSEVSGNDVDSL